jgi:hypothetical protein
MTELQAPTDRGGEMLCPHAHTLSIAGHSQVGPDSSLLTLATLPGASLTLGLLGDFENGPLVEGGVQVSDSSSFVSIM